MDDESGQSMEPMEEVPLKELSESVSGASREILDDADCILISGGGAELRRLLIIRALKTNSVGESALIIALTRSTF